MVIHREALELAAAAAAEDDGVPFTHTCLHLEPNGSATVTDGRQWLRMKAAVDVPSLFDAIAEEGTEALDEPVMIPAEVVLAFNAAMKRKKPKKDMPVPNVVVAHQDGRVTLRSSDGKTTRTFLTESIDPNLVFPDVDKTVLAHQPTHAVTIGVEMLGLLVRVLKACKVETVRLGLPPDPTAAIHLSAFSQSGPIVGAMMPYRPDEADVEPPSVQADDTKVSLVDTATGEVLFDGTGSTLKEAARRLAEAGAVERPAGR